MKQATTTFKDAILEQFDRYNIGNLSTGQLVEELAEVIRSDNTPAPTGVQTAPPLTAQPTHTPTPWRVTDEIDRIHNGEVIRPTEGNQSPVAVVCDFNRFDRDEERKGNAAFIVKAVNSHDALVTTLRAVGAFLEQLTTTGALDALACEWSHPDKVNRICDQVTAALNAVEQGEEEGK